MKLFLAMMFAMGAGALLVVPTTKAVKGAAQKTQNAVKSTVDRTETLIADRIDRWTGAVEASWEELQQKLLTSRAPYAASQPNPEEEGSIVPPPPLIDPWSAPHRPLYPPWDFGSRAVPRRRGRYFEK